MLSEERIRELADEALPPDLYSKDNDTLRNSIRTAVSEAAKAEREACCQAMCKHCYIASGPCKCDFVECYASPIRARSESEGQNA